MDNKGFQIRIACNYTELWRYNIVMMCGCFDEAGTQIDFVSTKQEIAAVGAELKELPEGVKCANNLKLNVPPCHHAIAYVYLVPHTLPRNTDIYETPPFPLDLAIYEGDKVLEQSQYDINQWSGASIELTFGAH